MTPAEYCAEIEQERDRLHEDVRVLADALRPFAELDELFVQAHDLEREHRAAQTALILAEVIHGRDDSRRPSRAGVRDQSRSRNPRKKGCGHKTAVAAIDAAREVER